MKTLKQVFLLFCFLLPMGLMAQSVVGTYKLEVPGQDGGVVPLKVELKTNNTYSVDVAMDGTIDWTGTYSLDGNKITIQDKGTDCSAKGVYTYTVDAKQLSMSVVKDDCPNRGNSNAPMVMTRM